MSEFVSFDTKRDFEAFGELLKRTELGNKDPGVVAIEPVQNDDGDRVCDHQWQDDGWDWHDCENVAVVRIVRNRDVEYDDHNITSTPASVYSDAYCLECVRREVSNWVAETVGTLEDEVRRARQDAEGDREVRTDGGVDQTTDDKKDSFGTDYAKVGELEIEAAEDDIHISGTWGPIVFGSSGETVEDAIESLANIVTNQPDPRPDEERDVYRCDGERPWQRCRNCDHLMSADHHEVLGTDIVACSWDDINDFDIFDERDGRAVKCPDCGGSVRDRPSEHVDGLANVECQDCGEEFFRETHDFGDYPAGSQELKRTTDDYEVVARVH